jgi:DNA polymerase (family 10)
VDNVWIARALKDVGSLLEIQGANPFRVRAYANAARTIKDHPEPISELVSERADLTQLQGVGKEIARHIVTLETQGETLLFREVAFDVPITLLEITRLPGLGAKKAKTLWQELDVTSVDDLDAAAKEGRVAGLPGFAEKTQQNIIKSIEEYRQRLASNTLGEADVVVLPLVDSLREHADVSAAEVTGNYRRRTEIVSDLRVLVACANPAAVVQRCREFAEVQGVGELEDSSCLIFLRGGVKVELRFVAEESFAASLLILTGSEGHITRLRNRAGERGIQLAEAGMIPLQVESEPEQPASSAPSASSASFALDEAQIYEALDLPWIPPELREDRGEIQAAESSGIPKLIRIDDMRGDMHMHSTWSDGRASLEEMLVGCVDRGYDYFAITDHSKALAMAGGLDAKKLRRQWVEVEEVAARHPEIRLLRGMEVDILGDGQLDLEDELLVELDVVLIAVHSRFNLPESEQTERVVKALQHPEVNILVHPTGRLLNRRGPIALDLNAVLECAAEFGVVVELNSHPDRLDLSDENLMLAKERGLKVVISTDAHRVPDLGLLPYGVAQARRAWLEKDDVLNTLACDEMLGALGGLKER